jgi:glutathione peroxidase
VQRISRRPCVIAAAQLLPEKPSMLKILALGVLSLAVATVVVAADKENNDVDFKVKTIKGKEVDLADKYKGKVLLVVNVASKCGLTNQYEQLESLHEKYADKGLAVLGFPCNQFAGQEPGTEAEIEEFCKATYDVKFDLFKKIDVNGDKADPLYKHLTEVKAEPKGPGKIDWNFEKFVIGRDGKVVARFQPKTSPDDAEVVKVIEAELAKK